MNGLVLSKMQLHSYRLFFQGMSDGVIFGSFLTQEITDANKAILTLSGYSFEELLSVKVDDLLVNQSHYVIGDSSDGLLAEGYLRKKNGEIIIVEMSGMIIDESPGIFGLVIRDITNVKTKIKTLQSRQDLLTIVSNISNQLMNISHNEIDLAIYNVLMEIADFSGSNKIYLFEYADSNLNIIRKKIEWPEQNIQDLDYFSRYSGDTAKIIKSKMVDKKPFILDRQKIDLQSDGILFGSIKDEKTNSVAIIPIDFEDQLIGFMVLEKHMENNEWGNENIKLYHLIGELLINALVHKQQHEAISRNEKNYRDLIYGSPFGILVMCSDQIRLINSFVDKLFKLESEKSIFNFYRFIKSDDRDRIIKKVEFVKTQCVGYREFFVVNLNNIDNQDIIIELFVQRIDYDYDPAVIFIFEDVTKKHMLEKQQRDNQRYSLELDQITRLAAIAQGKDKTLQMIADSLGSLLNADGCYISLWDEKKNIPVPAAAYGPFRGTYPNIKKENNEPTITEVVLQTGKTLIVQNTSDHPAVSERIAKMFPAKSLIGIPLIVEEKKLGAALISFNDFHEFSEDEIHRAENLVGPLILAFLKAQSHEDLELAYEETLIGWANAIELRERAAKGHSLRVAKASIDLGKMIGMTEEELKILRWGALLHDIGKMGIPDQILLKPGKLTMDEMEIMQTHADLGFKILKPIKFLSEASIIPLHHHERWDGKGYPSKLKGIEIPINARVFSIVDVWDALSTTRPYKTAWHQDQIIEYLEQNAGIQFDPDLVPNFIKVLNQLTPEWYETIFDDELEDRN